MGWNWGDWSRRYSAGKRPELPTGNAPYKELGLQVGPQHAQLAAGLWNRQLAALDRPTLLELAGNQDLSDSAVFTLVNEVKTRLAIPNAIGRARRGTYAVDPAAIGEAIAARVERYLGTRPDSLLDRLTRGSTGTGLWLGVWAHNPVPLLTAHRRFFEACFPAGTNRLHVVAADESYRDTRNHLADLKLGDRVLLDSSLALFPPGVLLVVRTGHGADGAVYLLKHGAAGWTEQCTGGRDEAQDLFAQFERLRQASPKPAAQAVIA